MPTLAEIRAKLAKNKQSQENAQSGNFGDNAVYPHWNIPEDEMAELRFLPDGDPNAEFFWKERLVIRLPFKGIKGQDENKPVTVQVPCMHMYGETDPILAATKDWWDDPELKDEARKYWKKRSYLFQGFVRVNPIDGDTTPENPIRRFTISPTIFETIKDSLMDDEIEELPTDYQRGLDFRIKKSRRGDYADYSGSNWKKKESPLTEEEIAAIEKHGLYNLGDFLPKKPGEEQLVAIMEMFEASVNGELYDGARWDKFYRPGGYKGGDNASTATTSTTTTAATTTPAVETAAPAAVETTPVAETVAETTPSTDALAALQARAEQTAAAAAAPAANEGGDKADAQHILDLIKQRTAS